MCKRFLQFLPEKRLQGEFMWRKGEEKTQLNGICFDKGKCHGRKTSEKKIDCSCSSWDQQELCNWQVVVYVAQEGHGKKLHHSGQKVDSWGGRGQDRVNCIQGSFLGFEWSAMSD